MEWQIILVIVLAVPIILLPVALVWYLNMAGLYAAFKEARQRKAAAETGTRELTEESAQAQLAGTER